MIKVIKFKKLKSGKKKYEITFEKNGKKYVRKFGSLGMSDYTIHKDKERRERYISRHKKDLRTKDPMKPGYLSMYILWNKPTIKASLADYKKRLNTFNRTGKFPTQITGSKKLSFGGTAMSVINRSPPPPRKTPRNMPSLSSLAVKQLIKSGATPAQLTAAGYPQEIVDEVAGPAATKLQKNLGGIAARVRTDGKVIIINMLRNVNPNRRDSQLINNYDITTDSGTEITEAMIRILRFSDFEVQSIWWRLVKNGLGQLKDIYDDFADYQRAALYELPAVIENDFETPEQYTNFTANEELLVDLVHRGTGIYFDWTESATDRKWVEKLLYTWDTKIGSNVFGKKGKGINQFGVSSIIPIDAPGFDMLPEDLIFWLMQRPRSQEQIAKWFRNRDPKIRILRLLTRLGNMRDNQIYRDHLQKNLSILENSGVEILNVMSEFLGPADYRGSPPPLPPYTDNFNPDAPALPANQAIPPFTADQIRGLLWLTVEEGLKQLERISNIPLALWPPAAWNEIQMTNYVRSRQLLLRIVPRAYGYRAINLIPDNIVGGVYLNGQPSPLRMLNWWRAMNFRLMTPQSFQLNQRSEQLMNELQLFGKKGKTTGSKIPDNVVNKALYSRIKAKIRKDVDKKKRRWGAYDSGRLVREYKAKGGKYRGGKAKGKTNLGRWYKEKWVDACAWPKRKSCGRKTKEKIAYCRPSKKVDSKTPKLVQDLTKAQIKSRCAKKKRNPMKRVTK